MMACQPSAKSPTEANQLYFILKKEFPSFSEEIVRNCIKECSFNYEQSKEVLSALEEYDDSDNVYTWSKNPIESVKRISESQNSEDNSVGPQNFLQNSVNPLVKKTSKLNILNNVQQEMDQSGVDNQENDNANFLNMEACSSSSETLSHNVTHTQTASQSMSHNNSKISNQLPFDGVGEYNYSNMQYAGGLHKNTAMYHSPSFPPSSHLGHPVMSNDSATQARPSYMRCDMQVKFRPPPDRYLSSQPTSAHVVSHQKVTSGNNSSPRHITRMYLDPQQPHIPNFTKLPTSTYSTSVNYALTPTERQTAVSHYQPLHIVTESTGEGITAVSTNFRPNSEQHGYLPNTTLPSPQLQIQHPNTYNMHVQNYNRMRSPRSVPPLPTQMSGAALTTTGTAHHFPPDVTTRPEDDHSFKQVFLQHQKSRLEHLRKKLREENSRLLNLRKEVNDMESEWIQKQDVGNIFSKDQLFELPILREQNRTLRVKCQCMAWEIDMFSPKEDQDFFSQLNTGPSLAPSSRQNRNRHNNIRTKHQERADEQHRHQEMQQDNIDNESKEGKQWKCVKCTFLNNPLMDKCEMCDMIRIPEADGGKHGNKQHSFTSHYTTTTSNHQAAPSEHLQQWCHQRVRISFCRSPSQTNHVRLNIKVTHPTAPCPPRPHPL